MRDDLTPRELQVARLIAWGACRKQLPDLLAEQDGTDQVISINTVNNILSNIYAKLSLNSETQLSAWYFVEVEGVDSSHSPFRQLRITVYSIIFLFILIPQITNMDQTLRPQRTRVPERTENVRGARSGRTRKGENEVLFNQ